MIPLSLKLKGLFSYRKTAEVDFTRLSEAGLFGIFGPVGSGKSTILDAISLALFGESDRLGGKDKRNYNLMNLQSDELQVEYRFAHAGEEYLFSVKGSRNSRNFETVKNLERRAFRLENGSWEALNEANRAYSAEEILGLSYRNFRKAVIVPQGKFMEFLQLGPKDRSNMMGELFHLERYDLYDPANRLLNRSSNRKQVIDGSLEQLQGVNKEEEQALQEELERLEREETLLGEKKQDLSKKLKLLEGAAEIGRELESLRAEHTRLDGQREIMEERRRALKEYESCRELFSSLLRSLDEQTGEYDAARRSFRGMTEKRDRLEADYRQLQEQHERLRLRFDGREEIRKRIEDLYTLLEIRSWQAARREGNRKLSGLSAKKELLDEEKGKLEAEAGTLRKEVTGMGRQLLFFTETEGLEGWYREDRNLREKTAEKKGLLEEAAGRKRDRRERLERLCSAFFGELLSREGGRFSPGMLPPQIEFGLEDLWESLKRALQEPPEDLHILGFSEIRDALEEYSAKLRQRSSTEDERRILHRLRGGLKQGDACPLCGSTEHPALFSLQAGAPTDAAVEGGVGEEEAEFDLGSVENIRNILLRFQSTMEAELPILRDEMAREHSLSEEVGGLEGQLKIHGEAFRWDRFGPDGEEVFLRESAKAHGANKAVREKNQALEELDGKLRESVGAAEELQTDISALEREDLVYADRIDRGEESLPGDLAEEYAGKSEEDLESETTGLRNEVARVEEEFSRLDDELSGRSKDLHQLGGQVENMRTNLRQRASKIRTAAEAAVRALGESGYPTFFRVRSLLGSPVDVSAERTLLEEFEHRVKENSSRIAELNHRMEEMEISYSPELHGQVGEDLLECEKSLSDLARRIGSARQKLEQLRGDLKLKKKYMEESRKIGLRVENLKVLRRLFVGKGFINFVATRYLHELCEKANSRFFSLTRKQLRLELDSENEFVIRDFMNGGHVRSLKTLSGGQLFQASFSLALALADGIHQNEEGFFFLDEGFGSLDRQALQDVFATLKTLRKENRIVGIISHVEQLRDEIPVFLEVRNTPEEGSIVVSRRE